jgi:hypothetical protein
MKINKANDGLPRMLHHIRTPTGFKMFREWLAIHYCEELIDFIALVIFFLRFKKFRKVEEGTWKKILNFF